MPLHGAADAAAFALFALVALVGPCAAFRVPPIDRHEPEADNSDSSDLSRSGARRELQDNPNPCPSCPDERVYWPESPINVCDTNCDAEFGVSTSCDEQCEILYSCDSNSCNLGDSVGDRCNEPFITSNANYIPGTQASCDEDCDDDGKVNSCDCNYQYCISSNARRRTASWSRWVPGLPRARAAAASRFASNTCSASRAPPRASPRQ